MTNIVGEASFDMYLNGRETKPLRPALGYEQIVSNILDKNARMNRLAVNCYCSSREEAALVAIEKKCVTECLVSSLNHVSNAQNILSLMHNYLIEGRSLREVSLKAFVACLSGSSGGDGDGAATKYCIQSTMHEQLRLHPSCAAQIGPRYRRLMLAKDEEFANLTMLEYVVRRLEQLVSVHNDVHISDKRTSRRRRRPVRMADESPVKRAKKVKVYVDSDEEEPLTTEAAAAAAAAAGGSGDDDGVVKKNEEELMYLLKALAFLVEIMRHDLGYVLKRRQSVRNCILAEIVFAPAVAGAGIVALNSSLFGAIFEVLRNCATQSVVRGVSELLELVGEVCALLECGAAATGDDMMDVACLGPHCRMLANELCASVFGEKPAAARAFVIVTNLRPEWLRYHASHYLVEKIFGGKMPFGMKGVANLFNSILKNVRREKPTLDTTNVLKLVDHNQLTSAGISETDKKKSVKSELDSDVAKIFSLNNVETIPEADAEDNGDKFNVRQKLLPIVCKILLVYLDSSVKIVKLTNTLDCVSTTVNFSRLKNILNELGGEKNVPVEFNMLRRQLNKIFAM